MNHKYYMTFSLLELIILPTCFSIIRTYQSLLMFNNGDNLVAANRIFRYVTTRICSWIGNEGYEMSICLGAEAIDNMDYVYACDPT